MSKSTETEAIKVYRALYSIKQEGTSSSRKYAIDKIVVSLRGLVGSAGSQYMGPWSAHKLIGSDRGTNKLDETSHSGRVFIEFCRLSIFRPIPCAQDHGAKNR